MDSSDDSSFVSFRHFPDLDLNTSDWIDNMEADFQNRKDYLDTNIKPLSEEFIVKDDQENFLSTLSKSTASKVELQTKLHGLNELQTKQKLLKSLLEEKVKTVSTSQEEINELMKNVLALENDKKEQLETLTHRRDSFMQYLNFYKHGLDCHPIYSKPDLYTLYFKRVQNKCFPDCWIKFRTDEFQQWEFIDANLSVNEKAEISQIFIKNGNIQEAVCRARQMFRSKSPNS